MSTKNKIQNAEKCYKVPIVSQGDVKKKKKPQTAIEKQIYVCVDRYKEIQKQF